MTYDQLLERLDKRMDYFDFPSPEMNAIRAIMELHAPFPSGVCGCELDSPLSYTYPCMTMQIIEKEIANGL